MQLFSHPEFDAHETVSFCFDAAAGLCAIIAVHDTHLGKALGGCRMWPYASEADALTDALRLSRGMTYKAALAGLPQGGGKSVIIGDPRRDKTPELMRAMGRAVDRLNGAYVIAEDSGTTVADMRLMAEVTAHVGGLADEQAVAAGRTGDPSPATAKGVFIGIRAAVRHVWQREDLRGLRVAVQGAGNVGYRLCRHLHEAGAQLLAAPATIFAWMAGMLMSSSTAPSAHGANTSTSSVAIWSMPTATAPKSFTQRSTAGACRSVTQSWAPASCRCRHSR